jgi:O-antigen ligase
MVSANFPLLYLTRSRAGVAAFLLALLIYSIFESKRLLALLFLGLVILVLASPQLALRGRDVVVYKGTSPSPSFATRTQQLKTSLESAKTRPLIGHGFGVSVGASEAWNGSLSLVDASREKSNSFLGGVEEVGLLGTFPLTLSILAILWGAFRGFLASGSEETKASSLALFAIGGACLLHANFEAWLTATGSYEAFIFWGTLGIIHFARGRQPAVG